MLNNKQDKQKCLAVSYKLITESTDWDRKNSAPVSR